MNTSHLHKILSFILFACFFLGIKYQSDPILTVIGSVFMLLTLFVFTYGRLFVNEKTNPFVVLAHWCVGSIIVWLVFCFSSLVKIKPEYSIFVLLTINLLVPVKLKEILTIKRDTVLRLSLTLLGTLVIIIFAHARWQDGYTQMTDLYNHNTVVNQFLKNEWAILPSYVTDSIQSNSYTTIFHGTLGYMRLVVSSDSLYLLQQIIQVVLIFVTFYYIQLIIQYFAKSWWISFACAFLFLLPYSPTPSFTHFSLVPNTFFVILLTSVIWLFDNQKNYKHLFYIVLTYLLLLHTFSFFGLLFAIVLWSIFLRLNLMQKTLCNITLLIVGLAVILFNTSTWMQLNIIKPIAVRLFSNELSLRASGPLEGFIGIIQFVSPFLLVIIITCSIYLLIVNKSNFVYAITYSGILLFLLSGLNIPFVERLLSLSVVFLFIGFGVFISKLKLNQIGKKQTVAVMTLLVLLQLSFLSSNKVDAYYSESFWLKTSHDSIVSAKKYFSGYNINTDFIIADPMTQMMAASVIEIPTEGSYMSLEQRGKIKESLFSPSGIQNKYYCNEQSKNGIIIINTRLLYWLSDDTSFESNTSNVWYDPGDLKPALEEVMLINKKIKNNIQILKTYNDNSAYYFYVSC